MRKTNSADNFLIIENDTPLFLFPALILSDDSEKAHRSIVSRAFQKKRVAFDSKSSRSFETLQKSLVKGFFAAKHFRRKNFRNG